MRWLNLSDGTAIAAIHACIHVEYVHPNLKGTTTGQVHPRLTFIPLAPYQVTISALANYPHSDKDLLQLAVSGSAVLQYTADIKALPQYANTISFNFPKSGVPKSVSQSPSPNPTPPSPKTTSFKTTTPKLSRGRIRAHTLKPGVPHPGSFPAVISLNPFQFDVYMSGLRKPRGPFLAAIRASFKSATKAAKVGDAADVPPISAARPPRKIQKVSNCAATSGIACFKFKKVGFRVKWWASDVRVRWH